MQAMNFTGEIGRLRAQELVQRAERYHRLERERRAREDHEDGDKGHFAIRKALTAFGTALILLLVSVL